MYPIIWNLEANLITLLLAAPAEQYQELARLLEEPLPAFQLKIAPDDRDQPLQQI